MNVRPAFRPPAWAVLWTIAAAVFCCSVIFGPEGAGTAAAVLSGTGDSADWNVLMRIRLPRAVMAFETGAVLASCGLAYQAVLRNPLAEPYILGISSGASVGVAASLLCGAGLAGRNAAALAGGFLVLAVVLALGRGRGREGFLLTGVMAGAFCGAVLALLLSFAGMDAAGSVVAWFMGDLGGSDAAGVLVRSLVFVPGCALLACCGHVLDMLQLGDEAAASLGLPVRKASLALLALSSVLVCVSTAATGPIGFAGLVVPQVLRLALGGSCARLFPAVVPAGALFLSACDAAARLVLPGGELPVGVVTALAGAPVFMMLLRRRG